MANIDRPAAGKTGTTDDHAATWFVGYTPQVAAPIWREVMTAAVAQLPK